MNAPRPSRGARLRRLFWICALVVLSAGVIRAGEAARPRTAASLAAAPTPPAVGSLSNGLQYTLLEHGRGLGRISLRLVVLAGTVDEQDGEAGYAHFVEHMAFNGTRHHPPGQLPEFFQALGVAYGADLNARTFHTHTEYRIDLPAGRSDRLGETLQVLRDFADGIDFAPAEVERERRVVAAEMAARNTNAWQVAGQKITALYAGTRLAAHPLGSDHAGLGAATSESLRAFHRRCYAPARLRLVLVGDISAGESARLLKEHFGSLRADRSAVPRLEVVLPPRNGPTPHIILSREDSGAAAGLMTVTAGQPDTPAWREERQLRGMVMDLLGQRLAARRASERARFGQVSAVHDRGIDPRMMEYGLAANATRDDWEGAVGLLETELRRARGEGFTTAEVAEQVAATGAKIRAQRDAFSGLTPDVVAQQIAAALAAGLRWQPPHVAAQEFAAAEARFTAARATQTVGALLPDAALVLTLITPQPPSDGGAALLRAYRASAARPLPDKPAARPTPAFQYEQFGAPGAVTERRTVNDLGIALVRYANGVRLNLRPSTVEPNRFHLEARIGRGLPDLPRDRPGLAHLAVHVLRECDLGRHPREEVRRLCELHALEIHAGYGQEELQIAIKGPAQELPFALQVLAAQAADAELQAPRFAAGVSAYGGCRATHVDTAVSIAFGQTMVYMAGGDERLTEPPASEVSRYPFTEVAPWIRQHWLEGPLEIGVSGDFSTANVIAIAAASVGAIPRRGESAAADQTRLAMRTAAGQVTRRNRLADQAAAVQLAWAAPQVVDTRFFRALALACDVLEDRLQKVVRQELGATYTASGDAYRRAQQRDFGYATVWFTAEPARAAELARRVRGMAADLGRQGATEEEFARLRAPRLSAAREALRSNAWWCEEVLAHAQTRPAALDDARSLVDHAAALGREEVNAAAAACLTPANASTMIVLPVAPATRAPLAEPGTAAEFVQRGQGRQQRGDLQGALADYDRAIGLGTGDAGAYQARASARFALGQAEAGEADLARALELDPRDPKLYHDRAMRRQQRGDLAGALDDCNRAIELKPDLATSYTNRAAVWLARNDHDRALADCTKAITLDPQHVAGYVNRGAVRAAQGDWNGALADASRAIALKPGEANAYHNRGYIKQQRGDLVGAMADYNQAIALHPGIANSHRQRAMLRQLRGDAAGALADYDEAVRNNPRDFSAFLNRGSLRFAQRDLPGARSDFEEAVRLAPDLADAYSARGWVRYNQGDLDGAIADCTRAIELNPNLAAAYINRATARRAKGDRFGAMDDYDTGAKLAPPPPTPPPAVPPAATAPPAMSVRPPAASPPAGAGAAEALVRLGQSKQSKGDFTGAIAEYTRAIELNPGLASAYTGRGLARNMAGDRPRAIEDFSAALALQPRSPATYLQRGYAYQARREFERAIADFSEAIKLNWRYAPAYSARGNSHVALDDLRAAIADYDRAIELSPNVSYAHAGRGTVRQLLGDFAGAVDDYDRAIALSRTSTYQRLYRFICVRRLGRDDPGTDFATAVAGWRREDWITTIGRFLLGELTEGELLEAAEKGRSGSPRTRACDAHYFVGEMKLIAGDAAAARQHFTEAVATNQTALTTHKYARAELKRLEERP